MALKKLAEETISQTVEDDAYVLVSQVEEIEGVDTDVVRRVPKDAIAPTITFSDPNNDGNIVVTIS